MGTGTASMGLKSRGKSHIHCRRCGKRAFHASRRICASCNYGKSARLRKYRWNTKYAER